MGAMSCPPTCVLLTATAAAVMVLLAYANKMQSGGKRRGLPEKMRRNKNKLSRTGTCLPRASLQAAPKRELALLPLLVLAVPALHLHPPRSKRTVVEVSIGPTPFLFSPALKDGGCGGRDLLPE